MSASAIDRRTAEYLCAANTGADIRTVRKIMRGKRAKGDVDTRVRRYLMSIGVTPLPAEEVRHARTA